MTKEIEKYVITSPSRFPDRDGYNGLCIEKVHVGESIESDLTEYVLDKITHSDNNITMEWWVRK